MQFRFLTFYLEKTGRRVKMEQTLDLGGGGGGGGFKYLVYAA